MACRRQSGWRIEATLGAVLHSKSHRKWLTKVASMRHPECRRYAILRPAQTRFPDPSWSESRPRFGEGIGPDPTRSPPQIPSKSRPDFARIPDQIWAHFRTRSGQICIPDFLRIPSKFWQKSIQDLGRFSFQFWSDSCVRFLRNPVPNLGRSTAQIS